MTPYVEPIVVPSTLWTMLAGFGPRFVEIRRRRFGPQLNDPDDALAGEAIATEPNNTSNETMLRVRPTIYLQESRQP
jgi:hypothetical protein